MNVKKGRENFKRKNPRNTIMYENGPMQKISKVNKSPWCMPTKEWMTKKIFQRGMVDEKGEFIKHKGIEQKGKTKTISLLLHNLFGI
jgi:hypothetical protein